MTNLLVVREVSPFSLHASSRYTLRLSRRRVPIWDPLILTRNISPIFGAISSSLVQARRSHIGLSIPTSFSPVPQPFRGCGPQSWSKWGSNWKIRPQRPRNRCIQLLLQKCEIDVILSDMSRHVWPTTSGLHHPGHPS